MWQLWKGWDAFRILFGKLENLEDIGLDGRIILE
jgi:hypothetical protein